MSAESSPKIVIVDESPIRAAILDGTVDAVCSDHTPVDDDEKLLPFGEATLMKIQKTALPQLNVKLLFKAGSAHDPKGKEGKRKVAVNIGISNGAKTELLGGMKEGDQVVLLLKVVRPRPDLQEEAPPDALEEVE